MTETDLFTYLGVSLLVNALLLVGITLALFNKPRPHTRVEIEMVEKQVPAASLPSTVEVLAQAAEAEADCRRLAGALEESIRNGWPFEPRAMDALSLYKRRKGVVRVKSARLN